MSEFPIISNIQHVQAFYEQLRRTGSSHNMAEICATRTPPGTAYTDKAFLEGTCNGRQFDNETPEYKAYVKAQADEAGVSTVGKVYKKQLAERLGDPEAWVSDMGDVKRLCEKRGMTLTDPTTDKVLVKPPMYTPERNRPRLAEDIVQREVANVIGNDPGRVRKVKDVRNIREEVIERMGSPK